MADSNFLKNYEAMYCEILILIFRSIVNIIRVGKSSGK